MAALEAVDWARLQNVAADPFRFLEAVVSGAALLAAGARLNGDSHVKGLTTGVGLWLAGAIGVAAGLAGGPQPPLHLRVTRRRAAQAASPPASTRAQEAGSGTALLRKLKMGASPVKMSL